MSVRKSPLAPIAGGKIRKSLYRCAAQDFLFLSDKIMVGERQVGEICAWQDDEGLRCCGMTVWKKTSPSIMSNYSL